MSTKSKAEKCCFCEKPIEGTPIPHFSKKLKQRFADRQCAHNYIVMRDGFGKGFSTTIKPAIPVDSLSHDGREKLKTNLEYCACQHKAKRHVEDGDGNLLHCRDCNCDHFWYAVPQTQMSTNLIELLEVTAEPTVVDKLEALAYDPNANPNERVLAHNRLLALKEKFSLAA